MSVAIMYVIFNFHVLEISRQCTEQVLTELDISAIEEYIIIFIIIITRTLFGTLLPCGKLFCCNFNFVNCWHDAIQTNWIIIRTMHL